MFAVLFIEVISNMDAHRFTQAPHNCRNSQSRRLTVENSKFQNLPGSRGILILNREQDAVPQISSLVFVKSITPARYEFQHFI